MFVTLLEIEVILSLIARAMILVAAEQPTQAAILRTNFNAAHSDFSYLSMELRDNSRS